METYCRDHQEQLAAAPLIITHLNTYAADIVFTQDRMALDAVPIMGKPVVQTTTEFQ